MLIFINGADAPAGRLFTLVHELVHIFLGQDGLDDGNEAFCNRIAARFLVPQTDFEAQWFALNRDFDALERFFKVSKLVLYRVALSYGKISKEEWQALPKSITRKSISGKLRILGAVIIMLFLQDRAGSFSCHVFESVQAGNNII